MINGILIIKRCSNPKCGKKFKTVEARNKRVGCSSACSSIIRAIRLTGTKWKRNAWQEKRDKAAKELREITEAHRFVLIIDDEPSELV